MSKPLLIEIGLEEMPARFIPGAQTQLHQTMTAWLEENRLQYERIHVYSTPRRLAIRVDGLAGKQRDTKTEARGPSKQIAQDEHGQWTKAALGFARGQGVDPDELFFRELKGVKYVYAIKSNIGRATDQLLQESLVELIQGMNFPKNMRWSHYDLRFVRPIRWLVVLFGEDVVPVTIENISAGRKTYGHRFLGTEIELASAKDYVDALRGEFVLVDVEERKDRIVAQIRALAAEKKWDIPKSPQLLNEVLHLVEYPTALFGSFDPQFLQVPEDVLITSMREHQRYFPVNDPQTGELLPYFVTVRNGDSRSLDNVARGNEKVLRARLADAQFFYTEDQKMTIEDALVKLESVVFHDELGSIGDKVRRIVKIAHSIGNNLRLDEQAVRQIERAATICKFDLVSHMVHEFPELQGIMGAKYAKKSGETLAVSTAITEHYQPRFAGDVVPASIVGAIVSIADKIDTVAGCFSIGIIPTGSQDPYALRRQAAGIVQTIHERDLELPLSSLFELALDVLAEQVVLKKPKEKTLQELLDFFALRVKSVLEEFASYDVIDAVMASSFERISATIRKVKALQTFISNKDNQLAIEAFNRVNNLASKAPEDIGAVQPERLTDDAEIALYEAWKKHHQTFTQYMENDEEQAALLELGQLATYIHPFFDQVMVMAEDEQVRQNRLALLSSLSTDIGKIADFQKIVRS